MLTRKQHELLMLIHARLQEEGVPPSFDEMKDALDLKSKSGIHRLITALEERGFIRRLPNRARALEVVKLPEGAGSTAGRQGFRPGVIEGGLSAGGVAPADGRGTTASNVTAFQPRGGLGVRYRTEGGSDPAQPATPTGGNAGPGLEIPVMGRIAAGVPISAIQDHTHSIAVPPGMIGSGEHYALRVQGDSMVEAGILDGDTVIIRNSATALPGEIVVALVDEEEATLKRFRRDGANIALEAANPAYETRVLAPNRVKVQGKLVGLIRQYN